MATGAATSANGDLERARRRPSFFHGARVMGGVAHFQLATPLCISRMRSGLQDSGEFWCG